MENWVSRRQLRPGVAEIWQHKWTSLWQNDEHLALNRKRSKQKERRQSGVADLERTRKKRWSGVGGERGRWYKRRMSRHGAGGEKRRGPRGDWMASSSAPPPRAPTPAFAFTGSAGLVVALLVVAVSWVGLSLSPVAVISGSYERPHS